MKKDNLKENTSLSRGQLRRVNRKKAIETSKRNAIISKVVTICVIAFVIVGLILLIGNSIYKNAKKIKPSNNYSAHLTEEGLIKDVTAKDYVNLPDYKNITVPLSEIDVTDEIIETEIKTVLDEHKDLSTETATVINEGDEVNIDYVGTIDGVEFEGGNSNGEGFDLVIGSNSFIDDFEDQLVGHAIGDKVTVNVTFPSEYPNNPDLVNKDAVFEVVINGIYVSPEFTDEFVKENLSELATTTEEFKEYVRTTKYNENLEKWLDEHLLAQTTVNSYPDSLMKQLKALKKYSDQSNYQYTNQLYSSVGMAPFTSFEAYVGMSELEYDETLYSQVTSEAKRTLMYQAILENENLSLTTADFDMYLADTTGSDFETLSTQYGKGYVLQATMSDKILDFIKEFITVK